MIAQNNNQERAVERLQVQRLIVLIQETTFLN
jgi:hypothetical protein